MFGLPALDLVVFLTISLVICVTVCALAMEASVLFTPAFLFLFPRLISGFPSLSANEAIGLAITVEFFGYTSSVTGYWIRRQIDFALAFRVLVITAPLAAAGRLLSYFVPGGGLVLFFGVVLVVLAVIIARAYKDGSPHGCLLCGDALMPMDGDAGETSLHRAQGSDASAAFNQLDRGILVAAGTLAGLVGIAIGEVSNTFLSVRKRVPIKLSTGTSALVLHLTILSALATNLLVLWADWPAFHAGGIEIPWRIAGLLVPIVILGGQIGSFLNSRMTDHSIVRVLTGAYLLVGAIVVTTTLLL